MLELSPAFASATLEDGSHNFLIVARRYGRAQVPNVQSPIILDQQVVMLATTLATQLFKGKSSREGSEDSEHRSGSLG